MSDKKNDNEFKDQQEGADKAAQSEAGVSPADYSDSEAGNTPEPTQPGSAQGDTNPESGNAEQQAETSGEDRGEKPGEDLEVPAEGSPAQEGTDSETGDVSAEDETSEADSTGEDEVEGGKDVATDDEKAELKSLEHKQSQTNLTTEDRERIEELNKLNHD